jgi:hypothetical protein
MADLSDSPRRLVTADKGLNLRSRLVFSQFLLMCAAASGCPLPTLSSSESSLDACGSLRLTLTSFHFSPLLLHNPVCLPPPGACL